MQEVDHYDEVYKPRLNDLGYRTVTAWRRGQDAVLIGYQESKFKLVDRQEIRYNDLWERYDYNRDYKRHNCGLIALLEHLETGQPVVVVNTHMFWNRTFDYVKYA